MSASAVPLTPPSAWPALWSPHCSLKSGSFGTAECAGAASARPAAVAASGTAARRAAERSVSCGTAVLPDSSVLRAGQARRREVVEDDVRGDGAVVRRADAEVA